MDVSAESDLDIIFFEQVQRHIPIVDSIIEWIVCDEDHGLIFHQQALESLLQPANVLRRPMAVSHLHDRPFMHPDEPKSAVLENKTILFPYLRKISRA